MGRYSLVIILAFLLAVSVFSQPSLSQDSDAELFFNKGLQKYLRGDLQAAVSDLEKAMAIEPENEKTKKFLIKATVDLGNVFFGEKDYAAAVPLLKRAYELAPGDAGVKNVYLRAESALKSRQEEENARKDEYVREQALKEKESKKRAKLAAERKAKRGRELAAARAKQSRKSRVREDKIIKEAQDRWSSDVKEQIKREEDREKKRKAKQSKSTFVMALLIVVGVTAIIFVLIGILRRNITVDTATTKQEGDRLVQFSKQHGKEIDEKVSQFGGDIKDILTNQMEKILKMMEEQSRAHTQETIKFEVTQPDGVKEIRTDVNPHIRARANGVELIEQTIDDPATGERLMDPFLSDVDSRVRANAAKGMYKYNKEKAMMVLGEMCGSSDQWMRLSGSWAMGEIGNDIAVGTLLKLLGDPKDFIVKRAIGSLDNILKNRSNELDEELINKVERRVKDARLQRKIGEQEISG